MKLRIIILLVIIFSFTATQAQSKDKKNPLPFKYGVVGSGIGADSIVTIVYQNIRYQVDYPKFKLENFNTEEEFKAYLIKSDRELAVLKRRNREEVGGEDE